MKKEILSWAGIGAVGIVIYSTGLHKDINFAMQRAMLWAGFFDAKTETEFTGPFLADEDYRFALVSENGENLDLETFKGDVVFINLWASWCPPCVAEMPTIQALYDDVVSYENIHFIMLSFDHEAEKSAEFMEKRGFNLPYYFPRSSQPEILSGSFLPTTFVISPLGQIVYKHEGMVNFDTQEFRDLLVSLAEE
ncbi:MAG: TlpA disulfide reductase family protein [Balneolaceae bacterium]